MSYFKFNGVSSDDLGLIITETPFRPSWVEETEIVTVPGRVTKQRQRSGIYSNQDFSIRCVISDTSKIDDIYNTLCGNGTLEVSTDSGKIMHAEVYPLVPRGVALTMAELEVVFDCEPFAYSAIPLTVSVGTSLTEVENSGTMYSEPKIEITMKKNETPILKGDVNFDGKITTVDAALVLAEVSRVAAGEDATFTAEQVAAADMNGDGILTPSDASAVFELATKGAVENPNTPSQNVILNVNGEELIIGVPNAVVTNGFTITIDSALKLIYYTNLSGEKINMLQYSYGDLPLLHTGTNYIKYTGDVDSVTVNVNERWR